jgi:hypothetical protein
MPDHPQWVWIYVLKVKAVAIGFDERAQAAIMRRRARGKDVRLFLKLHPGSLHAGVPWFLTVGWAPRHWSDHTAVVQREGDVDLYMDPFIAGYTRSRDLTISSRRVGPWEWLMVAEPIPWDDMREWEQTRPEDASR